MPDRGSDTLTVGELLARVRSTYVNSFAEQLSAAARHEPGRIIPEAAICRDEGEYAEAGMLDLPRRVDAFVFADGQVAGVMTFESENMLGFDPLAIVWGDGLDVDLHPFTWDACELRFAPPEDGALAPLVEWFRRWFDEADERAPTNDFPGGVVHSISGPAEEGDHWVVTVDLGSARLKAFEELIDAVASMNRARLVIGRPRLL